MDLSDNSVRTDLGFEDQNFSLLYELLVKTSYKLKRIFNNKKNIRIKIPGPYEPAAHEIKFEIVT